MRQKERFFRAKAIGDKKVKVLYLSKKHPLLLQELDTSLLVTLVTSLFLKTKKTH